MSSTPPPTLLVLAAGMGSRYGGLKQIDPVGPAGETIIDYSIYDAMRAGFNKLVFVIRRDIEDAFRQIVGARFEKRIPVQYVFQEMPPNRKKPWGTAHAILSAAGAVREPFAAINADDFYGADSYRLLAAHLSSDTADYAMVAFILRNTLSEFGSVARGVCKTDDRGFLTSVTELTKIERDGAGAKNTDPTGAVERLTGNEPVSMNFWGFTPAVLPQLQEIFAEFVRRSASDEKAECYIPTAVAQLIASGRARVKVLQSAASWFGVTYREDRPRVVDSIRHLVARGAYPPNLWR